MALIKSSYDKQEVRTKRIIEATSQDQIEVRDTEYDNFEYLLAEDVCNSSKIKKLIKITSEEDGYLKFIFSDESLKKSNFRVKSHENNVTL